MKNYKLQKNKKILKPYIKMDKKIIKFDDNEIEINKFQQCFNIDVNRILVSNQISVKIFSNI